MTTGISLTRQNVGSLLKIVEALKGLPDDSIQMFVPAEALERGSPLFVEPEAAAVPEEISTEPKAKTTKKTVATPAGNVSLKKFRAAVRAAIKNSGRSNEEIAKTLGFSGGSLTVSLCPSASISKRMVEGLVSELGIFQAKGGK